MRDVGVNSGPVRFSASISPANNASLVPVTINFTDERTSRVSLQEEILIISWFHTIMDITGPLGRFPATQGYFNFEWHFYNMIN